MSNPPEPPTGGTPQPIAYEGAFERSRPPLLLALGVASVTLGLLQSLFAIAWTVDAAGELAAYVHGRSIWNIDDSPAGWTLLGIGLAIAVIGVALAIFLVIIGIRAIGGRKSSRRSHVVWATAKVCVETIAAITAILSVLQIEHDASTAVAVGPGGGGRVHVSSTFAEMKLTTAGVQFALGIAYPIAVAILVTRRSVQAYASDEI